MEIITDKISKFNMVALYNLEYDILYLYNCCGTFFQEYSSNYFYILIVHNFFRFNGMSKGAKVATRLIFKWKSIRVFRFKTQRQ